MSQFPNGQNFIALGMMSGTSLDGLDLCLCKFWDEDGWKFEIIEATTVEYESRLTQKLRESRLMKPDELQVLDFELGHEFARRASNFLDGRNVDLVASHGHTIFHAPHLGMTLQIGHPAALAAGIGYPVVGDFRSLDVALGGQGAPLVPVGDRLLFGDYDSCLNLGGIANVSTDNATCAYDICPVNTVLNRISRNLSHDYDAGGQMARSGEVNKQALKKLNELSFYHQSAPKSLGIEWIEENVFPLLDGLPSHNALRTAVEHMAMQIGLNLTANHQTLVTGGGAHNTFMIERIKQHARADIIIPDKEIVDFKEALIFAFLGVLRLQEQPNTMRSVTGATHSSSGGAVYLPPTKS